MRKLLGLLIVFCGVMGLTYIVLSLTKQHQVPSYGTILNQPRDIVAFSLKGIDSKSFTNQNLIGQWTMLFFGFTNCASICPTTMAHLAQMRHILQLHKIQPLPRVVMISVDPQRDTLDKLYKYVTAFNPAFYGARGEQHEIRKLANNLGIAYAKFVNKNNSTTGYDIQHSGAVLLFNPQAKLVAFFTSTANPGLLAKNYIQLIN